MSSNRIRNKRKVRSANLGHRLAQVDQDMDEFERRRDSIIRRFEERFDNFHSLNSSHAFN